MMLPTPTIPFRFAAAVLCSVCLAAGCETPPDAATPAKTDDAHETDDAQHHHQNEQNSAVRRQPLIMDRDVNTARKAAMRVATMPPIEDALLRREILLYAALYEAAHEANVGDFTEYFLLDPPPDEPHKWYPGELAMDEREFALHVLAELALLNVPIAWTPAEKQHLRASAVNFPGTRELATRLRVRILERDENMATVVAEVSDFTAHVGGSRRRVEATWDGNQWRMTRIGPRIVW